MILLNTVILSKATFLSNIFPIPDQVLKQIETKILKHILQFSKKDPRARKTIFLPKTQGGVGQIEPKNHRAAMRIKHFLIIKEEHNQENWILLARYFLSTKLYKLHKDFRYFISNNTLKTDQPEISFYFEDIITFIKKHYSILNTKKNSRIIYREIIKSEYNKYNIIAQSI